MLQIVKKITWGDAFSFLGWLTIMCAITLLMILCITQKPTIKYSLGTDENRIQISIVREIDWWQDDCIILDRSITYWDAIRMVDSLNKTLPKKQTK